MKQKSLFLFFIAIFIWLNSFSQILLPGSTLATTEDEALLQEWLGPELYSGTLLFRMSEDGTSSTVFHSICDDQGPTVVIYRSSITGQIFGGYTDMTWAGNGYIASGNAFLFNFTNDFKLNVTNSIYSTYAYSGYGPTFGGGHDIYCPNPLNSSSAYCYPYSYENPSIYGQNFLHGGSSYPDVTYDEIEVYAVSPVTTLITSQPEDTSVCEGIDFELEILYIAENPTFQWYFEGDLIPGAISSSYTGESIPANEGEYYCILTDGETEINSDTAYVTIFSLPPVDAGSDDHTCDNYYQMAGNDPSASGSTGSWEIGSGGTGSFSNASVYNAIFTPDATGTYTFIWTVDNGNCQSADEVEITFNEQPTTADAGQDDNILCVLTYDLAANQPGVGELGVWTVISGSGTFDNSNNYNAVFTAGLNGTIILRWTLSNANCFSFDDIALTFEEDQTNPTFTCVDNQIINLNVGETFYMVQGTEFDPTDISDNCEVANIENDFNLTSTLANEQIPEGTTTITWTITDDAGNENNCSFDVTVNAFVGTETLLLNGIKISPNPANSVVYLEFKDINIQELTLSDITGKQILEKNVINQNVSIDISGLDRGIYLLTVQTSEGIYSTKIIKE